MRETHILLRPCCHDEFCKDCIVTWVRYSATCPVCRATIKSIQTQEGEIHTDDPQGDGREGEEWQEEGEEEREERVERAWRREEDWLEEQYLIEEWDDRDEERHAGTMQVTGEGIRMYNWREGRWDDW
jgi:hypothetical protein